MRGIPCMKTAVRKTKIIATLGPATESEESLTELMEAGVNVFRLNMSHAPHDWVRTVCKRIRTIAAKRGHTIGILMDTQGPAIRTGDLPSKLDLKVGDIFTFVVRGHKSEEVYSVDTNYDDLITDIKIGDTVLVDNGVIHMKVLSKDNMELRCQVLTPGSMGSRRHINLPGVKVKLPALTDKDIADLHVGIECKVDIVALSFVREAADVRTLRNFLTENGSPHTQIVAKIEDQSAVKNINEIIETADGVMVARGDLGVECPYEELPIIQRKIVKKCVHIGKPVIVATHMLESMISNPLPTRAEITDVANAVFEEADAIMLSGETTVGKYPRRCVEVLDRVAQRIERSGSISFHDEIKIHGPKQSVVASAVNMANNLKADGICIFTRSGNMAYTCAGLRPRHSPIFAFTPDRALANQLCLRFGITSTVLPFEDDPEVTIVAAEQILKSRLHLETGAQVVFVSDIIVEGRRSISSVQLRVLD